jgi:uncharacterized protein (DUF885 family)
MSGTVSALSPVYAIANEFVERYAAFDPIRATMIGVTSHDAEMTDFSPDGEAGRAALYRETLAKLEGAPILSDRDRIARDALKENLELRLDVFEAGDFRRSLSIIGAPVVGIRRAFELMPRANQEDWQRIVTRLGLVGKAVGSFERSLEEGVRRGQTGARRQALQNVRQAETWAGKREGIPSAFAALVDAFYRSGISSPGLAKDLERAVTGANGAFAGFAGFLQEKYLDAATETDGVGRERYALGSRSANGVVLDLEETYDWGWEELTRIEAEIDKTVERILPGKTVDEVSEFLNNDPARRIDGVDAYREWLQGLHDRALSDLHGVHFDIPDAIRRIEVMIPPPGGALAASYTGPSEDFSRPGRTWWPIPEGKTSFPMWPEVTTAYHEGVPGHHLERATAKYLAGELSRFQSVMGGTSGYIEGWALYAERLMAELGYLDNAEHYLGMLRAQAFRAVRVIIDIGMHLELRIPASSRFHPGQTWTPELAANFAVGHASRSREFVESEINRYLGTPGQAISYKVGERCWLEAREASKKRAGGAFDLKEWHRAALNLGPMGLSQMQRELAVL